MGSEGNPAPGRDTRHWPHKFSVSHGAEFTPAVQSHLAPLCPFPHAGLGLSIAVPFLLFAKEEIGLLDEWSGTGEPIN